MRKFSQIMILWKEPVPSHPRFPNGNPVSGYDYSELTKEGKDRAVKEIIKIIQYFGVLFPKGGGKYSLGSGDEITSILSTLRGLKIERFVGNCISQIGPDHKIFKNNKSGQSVVSSFSKYICYRYSSGLGKHRTLANELLESLISLKDDFLSEYKSKEARSSKEPNHKRTSKFNIEPSEYNC